MEEGMAFVQTWESFSLYLFPRASKSIQYLSVLEEVQGPWELPGHEDQLTVTCTETLDQALSFLSLWTPITDG